MSLEEVSSKATSIHTVFALVLRQVSTYSVIEQYIFPFFFFLKPQHSQLAEECTS